MTNSSAQSARKSVTVTRTRPNIAPSRTDPRLVNYESGMLISKAVNEFSARTGKTITELAVKLGIGRENIYAYRRGHQVPSPANRMALEQALGLKIGALKVEDTPPTQQEQQVSVTRKVEGDFLVITTVLRVPLSEIR